MTETLALKIKSFPVKLLSICDKFTYYKKIDVDFHRTIIKTVELSRKSQKCLLIFHKHLFRVLTKFK